MAYIMQMLLAFYSWFSIGMIAIAQGDTRQRPTTQPNENAAKAVRAVTFQEKVLDNAAKAVRAVTFQEKVLDNVTNALSTFLVEFQEAQCFFAIALAIAQLYANSQNAEFSDASNLADMLFQYSNVIMLTAVGLPCVALTQAGLRHASLASIYTLLWATVAAVLLGVSASTIMQPSPELLNDFFTNPRNLDLEACGNRIYLLDICTGEQNHVATSSFIHVVGSVYVLFGLLWLETIFTLEWVKRQLSRFERLKWSVRAAKQFKLPLVVSSILLLAQITLFCPTLPICIDMIMSFQKIEGGYGDRNRLATDGSWTIGQIIAMLVWAPSIAKYLYILVCELQ